jgi:hypothetical protein
MNCHLYLRGVTVYLPTMGKMGEGFYRGVQPVAVVSASNIEGIQQALRTTIARGNPVVPMLRRGEWQPPILLKYAGVKNWSAFERGMMFWTIKGKDDTFRLTGQKRQPDGAWRDDPGQTITPPPGSTVDPVIDRMIEILQDAARGAKRSGT